jgi:hypothetical protein
MSLGYRGRVGSTWMAAAFAVAGLGCGAGDTGAGPGRGQPPLAAAGASGNNPGGASGSTGAYARGGADGFGNPTMPPPTLPVGGNRPASKCLEPTVQFVVDGSGSMCEPFGASTRWQELRKALLDPMTGLIYQLSSRASFGMLIYDGTVDLTLAMGGGGSACAGRGALMRSMGPCPQLTEVPPAFDNFATIDRMYPRGELGGSTPTDRALKVAIDKLIAAQATTDLMLHPQYIVLATDGLANDICVGGVGGDGLMQQQAVITEVTRAAAARITTFVVSLAGGDAALEAHLAVVAKAGEPANPNARTYSPATPADLVAALTLVLGNALGCSVQ